MTVEEMGWKDVHARLIELAVERAALDYEEAVLLVAARRLGVHGRLGYGSLLEYVERTLGHQPKVARERLRVAEALGDLPAIAGALRDGTLSWSAARELTRIAVGDTDAEWLEVARGRTIRDVEGLVAGRLPGDRPSDVPSDEARRHVLQLEISGATLALFREAREKLVRESGGGLEDEEVIRLMARQVLGGPTEEGRASYQIAVFVCERCERGWQQGRGERIAVEAAVVAQARCDAQIVGDVAATTPARASQDIPPAVRRQVRLRDHGRCVVTGCRQSTWVDVHHLDPREEHGGHDAENLCVMCEAHHAAVHDGRLVIGGRPATGLTFRHADGTPYGGQVRATVAEAATDAFLALRALGYKEKEARRAIAAVMPHVGHGATAADVLRRGLAELRIGVRVSGP